MVVLVLLGDSLPRSLLWEKGWNVPEVKVDVLSFGALTDSATIDTGLYLDAMPILFLSDGAIDGA